MFGPSSLEAEDNLLRLDRTLADLLAYVDKHVGLKNTLVVGLIASPDRLIQIRRNRLLSLNENRASTNIDQEAVREGGGAPDTVRT